MPICAKKRLFLMILNRNRRFFCSQEVDNILENENDVKELENNTSGNEEETKVSQSEANETKTETGTELDEQTESDQIITESPTYTSDLIETDNFTLQVDHYMTAGDMLVSTLLAANIAVMLLCRLLRDRK